jgi:transposase
MPKGQEIVYRCHSSVKKENLPVNSQIQNGGFSVMFWGCFSVLGLGPLVALEGNQNQHTYKELLKEYLVPEIRAAKDYFDVDMTFMQDNAPCHKTKMISDFLARNRIPVLDWPPSSPDINPIENLWSIIKRKRQKKFGVPATATELIEQIYSIWEELDVELCQKLSNSVEKRLLEVIRLNGRPTKY